MKNLKKSDFKFIPKIVENKYTIKNKKLKKLKKMFSENIYKTGVKNVSLAIINRPLSFELREINIIITDSQNNIPTIELNNTKNYISITFVEKDKKLKVFKTNGTFEDLKNLIQEATKQWNLFVDIQLGKKI